MNIQALKNKVLQLAIEGKLVEQRPKEGTGQELFNQIQEEKQKLIAEGKNKKEKALASITEEEIPFDIPVSWKWVRLGELISIESGQFLTKSRIKGGPFPVFGGNGVVGYHNEYLVDKETIIIGRVGFYCGSIHVTKDKSWITDNAFITKYPKKFLDTNFLSYELRFLKLGSTGNATAQPVVSGKRVYPILFALPPLEEQKRIVAKIEEIFSALDKLQMLFDENANIKVQLKKKILQYAIEGKLVEQRSEEGTGLDLFNQIQEEKQKLIAEGKIKKEKALEPITDEEIPFDIPDSWLWCRVNSISEIDPRNNLSDDKQISFIPMKLVDDGFGNHYTTENKYWKDVKKGFNHIAEDDIGVAKITPCFQNRKSVIFKKLPFKFGATTTELKIVRRYGSLQSSDYLFWFFKTNYFIENGVNSFTGSVGQQRIHKDYLESCLLPLPPLEEQKRIVAKIEELFALCDKLDLS
ncbi:MAG: restriction endonuclease subunit S [Succinivibrio sp.]|nr:restriction endonuclease subunit S [Succinivibrio sp.]